MSTPKAMRQPLSLKLASNGFLLFWCLLAAFPLFWIGVMSFKVPVDAFAANPFDVIFGPETRAAGKGLSVLDILVGWLDAAGLSVLDAAGVGATAHLAVNWLPRAVARYAPGGQIWLGWILGSLLFGLAFVVVFVGILPAVLGVANPILGPLGLPVIGLTTEHYQAVWFENAFYRNFLNSLLVTAGVVTISLTVGTLAGYGLARSGSQLAFWLLILALIFPRPAPFGARGRLSASLHQFRGKSCARSSVRRRRRCTAKPWAVIAVLVSINQPFTIWMLRSFFQNIPTELDEAARVDGCSHFEAFRRVIMPVMWPGVITTGLFSFLLAYNDFLVTSLLLDAQNMTMVPAIAGYFNRETTTTDQVEAVAAAVSITAPLFLLVMVFQRQIVSGLTAGAVKG